jgi:hypothetical protein
LFVFQITISKLTIVFFSYIWKSPNLLVHVGLHCRTVLIFLLITLHSFPTIFD